LFIYQIKTVIKPYKTDEFDTTMHSFSRKIFKEKGCLGYSVSRDSEKKNIYSVIGEWKTRKALEEHFQTNDFEVLIGSAKVLGETFTMNISKTFKTGGFDLARKQIESAKTKEAAAH
jgi:quinol monooxygenase YgiN